MQKTMNVSLDQTTEIKCDNCGNTVFQEGLLLRKVSRLLTGTDNDTVFQIQVFCCNKCSHVNDDFLPEQLRGLKPEPPLNGTESLMRSVKNKDTGGKIIPFTK